LDDDTHVFCTFYLLLPSSFWHSYIILLGVYSVCTVCISPALQLRFATCSERRSPGRPLSPSLPLSPRQVPLSSSHPQCLPPRNRGRSPSSAAAPSVRKDPTCHYDQLTDPRALGKSSLTVQFVEHHFVESYYPTIENTFSRIIKHNGQDYATEIVDTAGQVRSVPAEIQQTDSPPRTSTAS
jgi:hypothetical protein